MKTTMIRGREVMAKENGYPFTFSNRAQAERRAAEIKGVVLRFPGSRPFYVAAVKELNPEPRPASCGLVDGVFTIKLG